MLFDEDKTCCYQGEYASGDTCEDCPAGKYSFATGATSVDTCVDCAAGTYSTSGPGQTDSSVCVACDAGFWTAGADRSQCQDSSTVLTDLGFGSLADAMNNFASSPTARAAMKAA